MWQKRRTQRTTHNKNMWWLHKRRAAGRAGRNEELLCYTLFNTHHVLSEGEMRTRIIISVLLKWFLLFPASQLASVSSVQYNRTCGPSRSWIGSALKFFFYTEEVELQRFARLTSFYPHHPAWLADEVSDIQCPVQLKLVSVIRKCDENRMKANNSGIRTKSIVKVNRIVLSSTPWTKLCEVVRRLDSYSSPPRQRSCSAV